ncbi:hypothetical protein [Flavobacterium sp. K5-23]|uniref:hypothetical protein n=1 Tax=Flavobacterium sp. K5-23 TaxID=2746225 RepID=UPI00200D0B24|nr:hypothetical protein [Flavobacterium sp. K5-23]UQD57425.1 hypothetical protein FLAK523_13865 [Flavobacterium sp. K5-23]
MKNHLFLFSSIFLLLSCKQDSNSIVTIYTLPKSLKEVSGISYSTTSKLLWTLEDSGNENKIYGLNSTGKIEKDITIDNTLNIDWEDITKDREGNLYIGDFGNNDNIRTDLCIYKIDKTSLVNNNAVPVYKIAFDYPEQIQFPPKKKGLFYDVEGFFEFKNNFYLFTKNRSKGYDGTVFIYKVPNAPGMHKAQLIGEFKTCSDYDNCAITSAAISPDETKVVLLSHSKIWLFENFSSDDFLSGTKTEIELQHYSQKEAICFKDNTTLLIADERVKKTGGKLYEININKLKSKP